MEKLKNRSEVPENLKWDLTRIFKTEEEYEKALEELNSLADKLVREYKSNIKNSKELIEALDLYNEIKILISHTNNYSELDYSVDMTDEKAKVRVQKFDMFINELLNKINFFENEVLSLDKDIIAEAIENTNDYKMYLTKLLDEKAHMLSPEEEKVISMLRPATNAPYKIYSDSKLADMLFDDFEVDGKIYSNSFVMYENFYCHHTDTKIRRAAYESFSKGLDRYKNTFAAIYVTHIKNEKQIATLRGFNSVIDYLLFEQRVDRELYDRQIDLMMEKLSIHMRKYARLIKEFYGLDTIKYSDLKVPIDSEFVPKITAEETKPYVENALSVMGEEYLSIAMRAYSDRWIDFANNIGKSTGGFCSSPYRKGSYILLSFSEMLNEVYTLVHEIGHGVHFHYAQQNNNSLEEEPSLYIIEAPSTINELLLSDSMLKKAESDRFKRFVYSAQIANTYYHNCVTHLLEAAYQREVYKMVDAGEPITEKVLTEITKDVFKKFWGDEVEIDDYAGLTWMRQPHYYMGLYSYTYSAGLSVATEVARRIREGDENATQEWIELLKKGGSIDLIELCKVAGVDITKADFILNTIEYIGNIINKIEELM